MLISLLVSTIYCLAQSGQLAELTTAADPKFTLDETLKYVGNLKKRSERKLTPPQIRLLKEDRTRLFDNYSRRGVAFEQTSEKLEALRKAGIDDEFLDLIKRLAPLHRQPPPPPPGIVEIACDPAECMVSDGKHPAESTNNGLWVRSYEGLTYVDLEVAKERYVTVSERVPIQLGTKTSRKVGLKLDGKIPEKEARESLEKVWTALGAGESGANLQEISATGAVSLFDSTGKETDWRIAAKFNEKSVSSFEFTSLADKPTVFRILCDNPCRFTKISKATPKIDSEEASWLLTKFRPNDLGGMIRQLTAADVRLTSSQSQPSGNRIFKFEKPGKTFEMEVGSAQLPSRVFVTDGNDVYEVIYTDYVKISETSQYPRHTDFRMKTNQRGVKIDFSGTISKAN